MDPSDQRDSLRRAALRAGFDQPHIALPEERYMRARGLRLHYLDWLGSGAPLVFLHGGRLTAHTWDLVCLAMRHEFRCIALDLRGHGDSEWPRDPDYALGAYRDDVIELIARIGFERCVLVGMSLGGLVALSIAADRPKLIDAIVLVDIVPQVSGARAANVTRFARETAGAQSLDDLVASAMRLNPRRDPDGLRRSLLHNLRPTSDGKWRWKYDPRQYRADLFDRRMEESLQLRQGLCGILCPVLLVTGSESEVTAREDALELMQDLPRGEWIEIAGAGHSVQGDRPLELVHALRGFLLREAGPTVGARA